MVDFIHEQGALFMIGFSFFFLICVLGLNRLQRSLPSPLNKLFIRWLRLFLIALFVGLLFKITVFPNISYWRLCVIAFLLWALLETLYLWLYILAWDKSELPLFPDIDTMKRVDWPANKRFFLIRDWIRHNNYEQIGAFRHFYAEESLQQSIIYQSPDKTIRMQVLVVPDSIGVILDQIVFISETSKGVRVITDNVFMPFGGIYPKNWNINRFPSMRKIERLAKMHTALLAGQGETCVQINKNPLEWIESSQEILEEVNVEHGLLNLRRDRNEFGKMTGEGRYRIWKELLLLNYFCKSIAV